MISISLEAPLALMALEGILKRLFTLNSYLLLGCKIEMDVFPCDNIKIILFASSIEANQDITLKYFMPNSTWLT